MNIDLSFPLGGGLSPGAIAGISVAATLIAIVSTVIAIVNGVAFAWNQCVICCQGCCKGELTGNGGSEKQITVT